MTWAALLAAAERIRAAANEADPVLARLPLAAIGWATVEAERAIRELDTSLAIGDADAPPGPWTPLDRDPALGARVWQRRPLTNASRPAVLVLEPDTEGRLAASLARFGEGVAVVYLGAGPVRPGRLVGSPKPWGPHVVVL